MLSSSYLTPRPPIDLSQVTESTRRALYDAVVEVHFSPSEEEVQANREDPENHWIPEYGPTRNWCQPFCDTVASSRLPVAQRASLLEKPHSL